MFPPFPAPEGGIPAAKFRFRQGDAKPLPALVVNHRPVTPHAEQKAAAGCRPHREQLGTQFRKPTPQQRQRLGRAALPRLRGQLGEAAALHRQYRVPGGVPQAVPSVPESRQRRGASQQRHPDGDSLPPQAVGCRRPENHCHQQVDARCRNQQNSAVDVGVEHPPGVGDALPCQQSQCQNHPRQHAGNGKGQQRQPPEMPFTAEGQQRQQHAGRRLHRKRGQKAPSRQEHRRSVKPSQNAAEGIALPPQRNPRQTGRRQHQQIIQQGVEQKHAVQIDYRHRPPPFQEDYSLPGREKRSQTDRPQGKPCRCGFHTPSLMKRTFRRRKNSRKPLENAGFCAMMRPEIEIRRGYAQKAGITLLEFLEQEQISPNLLEGIRDYRSRYPAEGDMACRVPKPRYHYYGKEVWEAAIAALLCGENLLLAGSKATGKNVLAENLAMVFGRPCWDVSFHVNMDAASLIGMDTFENGQVTFRPGPVYLCARNGGFGILDEINMAKNEALAVLHAALDFRRAMDVPGYSRVDISPAARFIGTMNYGYAGTRELNEALTSRFVVIQMPPIDGAGLERLLGDEFPTLERKYRGQFVQLFLDLQKKCESAEISAKALDLRGLLDALRLIRRGVSAGTALDMGITNKAFDSYEQSLIRDVITARIPAKLDAGRLFTD